jgi:hypothetical protein
MAELDRVEHYIAHENKDVLVRAFLRVGGFAGLVKHLCRKLSNGLLITDHRIPLCRIVFCVPRRVVWFYSRSCGAAAIFSSIPLTTRLATLTKIALSR